MRRVVIGLSLCALGWVASCGGGETNQGDDGEKPSSSSGGGDPSPGGAVGTMDQFSPVEVPDLKGVVQITTGASHACALLEDTTVECWGDNYYRQLGLGETAETTIYTPTTVPGLA